MKIYLMLVYLFYASALLAQINEIPACISNKLEHAKDSLSKFKIASISLVEVKGNQYYKLSPDKNLYRNVPITTVWTDSNCVQIASITIGGVAGVKHEGIYNYTDFREEKLIEEIWNVDHIQDDTDARSYFSEFQRLRRFKVIKIVDNANPFHLKVGDIIDISTQKGLTVKPKIGKSQTYKIEPHSSTFRQEINCVLPPCNPILFKKHYFIWDTLGFQIKTIQNTSSWKWLIYKNINPPKDSLPVKNWIEAYLLEEIKLLL